MAYEYISQFSTNIIHISGLSNFIKNRKLVRIQLRLLTGILQKFKGTTLKFKSSEKMVSGIRIFERFEQIHVDLAKMKLLNGYRNLCTFMD